MPILHNISWNLIYRDTFDRETPPSISKTGTGIKSGILYLWQYTLSDGITKNGNRSFSSYNLTFEDTKAYRDEANKHGFSLTDNVVNVWYSATALAKLRAFIYGDVDRTGGRESYIEKGGMLINILTEYHYNKLSKKDSSLDVSMIKKISEDILNIVNRVDSQQELLEFLIK
ncbi:MAG: hypothetical protein DRJ07_05160 [Bacteroidetes bacterium]|nr:MAG: hypothetical protein DRJ07_05160 [Bacteroidota bacterium]